MKNLLRVVYWAVLVLLILGGLYGAYERIIVGKEVANYGSLVPWGLWIALYTYLAGLAAGLYLLASLGVVFNWDVFKPVRKVAAAAAVVALSAGLVHVWFDLGHMERFWEIFFRPSFTSIMGAMPWFYTAFIVVVVVQFYLEAQGGKERTIRWLGILGIVFAIIFSGGEGALLGVLGSRPSWHAGLFPIRFLVAGLVTASAALLVLVTFFWKNEAEQAELVRWLRGITLGLLAFSTLMEFADISTALYGGSPAEKAALQAVLTGHLAWAFWGGQVLLGIAIPGAILLFAHKNRMLVGFAGLVLMVGFVAARMNLLVPVLSVPELEGITEAYHSTRLSTSYFPSLIEWLISFGILSLALAAYTILWNWLHLATPGKFEIPQRGPVAGGERLSVARSKEH
ncbi:MAG: polysulfide reductase NrfD [Anaerolineae bacterium]